MKAKLIGTLMVLAAGAAPSMAFPCRQQQVVVVQKQIVQAEVVYPVVQQVVVPVYGLVPLYQPQAYVAPQAAPQVQSDGDTLRELVAEFRALRGELQALRAGPPAAKQEAPKVDFEAVIKDLRVSCAKCHSEAGFKIDGGGLMLFKSNGEFVAQTPEMGDRMARRVNAGSMPPMEKLDPVVKDRIVKALKH